MHCFISTAAYHAYWRRRGVWHRIRPALVLLCVLGGAAVVGGGPALFTHPWPRTGGLGATMRLDAP